MSPPWSKRLDVDRLADSESGIDFDVPLAELRRLRSQIPGVTGSVRGRAHFSRESGFAVVDLTLEAAMTLVCQRCLGPLTQQVSSTARVALIASEADASNVPEHLEPVLAAGGQISIGEVVEEELLLAVPLVSLHARLEDCTVASVAPVVSDPLREQTTQRPFERLNDLLKR